MYVSTPFVRAMIEAAEARAVAVDEVLRDAGLSRADLRSRDRLAWPTVVRICDALARSVGGDRAKLEAIGAAYMEVSAPEPLRRLGRHLASPAAVYDVAIRWVTPVVFPHLPLTLERPSEDVVAIRGHIPEAYEGSEAFLRLSVGSIVAAPALVDAGPSTLLEEHVTDRTIHVVLRIPSKRPSLAGALRRFLGRANRDAILERHRSELVVRLAETHRANAELRALLERLPDMILVHVDGRILFVNRAFIRTMGFSCAEEVQGKNVLDVIDPRSKSMVRERMTQPPDAPSMPEVTDLWAVRRDGTPIHIEITPTQAVVFDGKPARLVAGRDIGERERLQQKLAAADRLASLGLLAAGVAHEVNNPLAYVLNNIEIARKNAARLGDDARPVLDALGVALEGVDRIRFIVRELLQLARVDPTEAGSTDIGALARSTVSLARAEIERTGRLTLDVVDVPAVRGSVPHIAQIMLNLVLNATDAMREAPSESNELVVRVRPEGEDRVLLEVADTGAGVPTAHANRIFDPFFTTKPGGQGTGLGLTITQRLVADLGGEISFTSVPGRGTTFRVLLPVARAD